MTRTKCIFLSVGLVVSITTFMSIMRMGLQANRTRNNFVLSMFKRQVDRVALQRRNKGIQGSERQEHMEQGGLLNNVQAVPLNFQPDYWHKHTRSVCKSLGMNTDAASLENNLNANSVVDDKHKLIMCKIAKVASTYIGRALAILFGQTQEKDPNHIPVHEFYKRYMSGQKTLHRLPFPEALYKIKTYFSTAVVREPFGRLLSAYRDKIQNPWSNFYIGKARAMSKNKKAGGNPNFAEFIAYITHSNPANRKDVHWAPYYKLCTPCEMNYDFVVKLETMAEDFEHVYDAVNASDIIVPPREGIVQKSDELLKEYYSQVPRRDLRKLYEIYKPDFLIFNYTVPDVIKNLMS